MGENPLKSNTGDSDAIWKLLQNLSETVKRLEGNDGERRQTELIDEGSYNHVLKENLKLKKEVDDLKQKNCELQMRIKSLESEMTRQRSPSLHEDTMVEDRAREQLPHSHNMEEEDTVMSSEAACKRTDRRPVNHGTHFLDRFAVSRKHVIPSSPTQEPTSSSQTIVSSSPLRTKRNRSMELDFGDATVARIISGDADINTELFRSQSEKSDELKASPHKRVHRSYSSSSNDTQILVPDSQSEDECRYPLSQSHRLNIPLSLKYPLDLSENPIRHSPWWPEDFRINPLVNFGQNVPVQLRKLDPKYIHPVLKKQLMLQKRRVEDQALKEFDRIAGPVLSQNNFTVDENANPKPNENQIMSPTQALEDPDIDPIFKFELNRDNYMKNRSALGNLSSKKIKLWMDLTDSPPGEERSSFPTSQEVKKNKEIALKRAKLVGLQRLFQAVLILEPRKRGNFSDYEDKENIPPQSTSKSSPVEYSQVGKFIFCNSVFNDAVKNGNFKIDRKIFKHS